MLVREDGLGPLILNDDCALLNQSGSKPGGLSCVSESDGLPILLWGFLVNTAGQGRLS